MPYRIILLFISCNFFLIGFSQRNEDSLLQKIANRFVKQEEFTLEKILPPAEKTTKEFAPEHWLDCYSGKQVEVVAVYRKKPAEPYGRMLVMKKLKPVLKYDEHLFQPVEHDDEFNIDYSLIRVAFPAEANRQNCRIDLQVYDKGDDSNGASLIILTK